MVSDVPPELVADRLGPLLSHFSLEASTFFAGELCRRYTFTSTEPGALLHIARGGRVISSHQGNETVHQPTSLLFYPRPLDHGFRPHPDDSADVICARVKFRGGDRNPFAQSLPSVVALQLDEASPLQGTGQLMYTEMETAGSTSRASLDRLSEVLIIQLLRDQVTSGQVSSGVLAGLASDTIGDALLALHEDPAAQWNVQRLADQAHMSRTQFSAEFGRVVGQTPMSYVNHLRVELAMRELEIGRSVTDTAYQLGFSSPSALSRSFRNIVGTSPASWRRTAAQPIPPAPGRQQRV